MHIFTVLGTCPQYIKAAEVTRALDLPAYSSIQHTVFHADQHYERDISEGFFREHDISEPDMKLAARGGDFGE